MRSGRVRRSLELASFLALLLIEGSASAQPHRIGGTHPRVARSPSGEMGATPLVWNHRIAHPGASYLRVELSMELGPGDVLEVLDARGEVRWRYGGSGPLGGETFLTDTVFDDALTLRLVAQSGEGEGVSVSGYEAGLPWSQLAFAPETACHGASPFQDLTCILDASERRIGEAVCAILLPGGTLCTGSFVSPRGHVLTANHCVPNGRDARRANLWLRYQERCGETVLEPSRPTVVPGPLRLLIDDRGRDVSLLLPPVNGAQIVGHLPLEDRDPHPGEPLFTVSHPGGRPKELTRGVALSEPFEKGCIGTLAGTHFAHRIDTQSGSSGAPIVREATGCVIGVHTCGGCQRFDPGSSNGAVRARSFLPEWVARVPELAMCGSANFGGHSTRGARIQVDALGTFEEEAVAVLPGGEVRFEVARDAHETFVLLLDALRAAPRFANPGESVVVALPWNLLPGAHPISLRDARGLALDTLLLDVGEEVPSALPSFARWRRVAPAAHEVLPTPGTVAAVAGEVSALAFAEDGAYRASGWFLEPGPPNTARYTFLETWTFDLSGTAIRSGDDLAALRLRASLFARSAREGAVLEPFPAAPRRSSDALAVHAWRFEFLDVLSNTWHPLPSFLDPDVYSLGSPWRGTPYAESWSGPGTAWPGPIDSSLRDPPAGLVDATTGTLRLRLRLEVDLERGAQRQSVAHVVDELFLDLLPRGVLTVGQACEGSGGVVPRIAFEGTMRPGGTFTCQLLDARPATPAYLFHGLPAAPTSLAFLGSPECSWHVLPDPDPLVGFTDEQGSARRSFAVPSEPIFAGRTFGWQWAQLSGAPFAEVVTSPALWLRISR